MQEIDVHRWRRAALERARMPVVSAAALDPNPVYCVYRHLDPLTKETVYVGSGTVQRARSVSTRRAEHRTWLQEQTVPITAIIRIEHEGLLRIEAFAKERELIKALKPRFNRASVSFA